MGSLGLAARDTQIHRLGPPHGQLVASDEKVDSVKWWRGHGATGTPVRGRRVCNTA